MALCGASPTECFAKPRKSLGNGIKIAGRVNSSSDFCFEKNQLSEMGKDALMGGLGIHIDNRDELVAACQPCHDIQPRLGHAKDL